MSEAPHWTTVTESQFSWEREALDFVRERFPLDDGWRAWANFEFIAGDGSINEVDLLVFSPKGLFLVEIKSRPGRLAGDAGTWTWYTDGRVATVDNPVILANQKAKKLKSLLDRQRSSSNHRIPYIEALVFCSAQGLQCELEGPARTRVCLRDREPTAERPARAGVWAAISERECPGLERRQRGICDRPTARAVAKALESAGVRPSESSRRVGDFRLGRLIGEGPGYQDWDAQHVSVEAIKRRVRVYLVNKDATPEEREQRRRAADREFQLLDSLKHNGVLQAHSLTQYALGPALVLEHYPGAIRLDHYLAQVGDQLPVERQLDLVRQLAEVVQYAHENRVVHRGLAPQSILITDPMGSSPQVKVLNWQSGYRDSESTTGGQASVSATAHVDRLVENAATAYLAPEALTESGAGEHLDVFSLGAIAYHIFSGTAPAADAISLGEKLRGSNGLQISDVLNGARGWMQELIQSSTHPVVANRTGTVAEFLLMLDEIEKELTDPDDGAIDDPTKARIGDLLPGGFRVKRRLGKGACSVALLVERDGSEFVLKVANSPEQSDRLQDEAQVLQRSGMRHKGIVELVDVVEIGRHFGFLMPPIVADRDSMRVETLGQRLRREGRLHIDLLQRFGDDILEVVSHLDEQGVDHRDIKPDNIAVGMVGRGDRLHAVLFDFSLSRTPRSNIRAGTAGYLDPMLPLRDPPVWDHHAERYAAAATLYELATGTLPTWGDGVSDPSHLADDVEADLELELLDEPLRAPLGRFFARAFRRDPTQRFDNPEAMLAEWRKAFSDIDDATPLTDEADDAEVQERLRSATFDSQIHELGLGTRATNALDRANVLTVEDLLTTPMRRLSRLRGWATKPAARSAPLCGCSASASGRQRGSPHRWSTPTTAPMMASTRPPSASI